MLKIFIFFVSFFIFSVDSLANESARNSKLNIPARDWSFYDLSNSSREEIIYAANEKNAQAMYLLASSFEYGINGFDRNYSQALYWNKLLLKTDRAADGYLGLANIYSKGKGVDKNIQKAREYFNEGLRIYRAKKGDDQKNLARIDAIAYVQEDFVFGNTNYYLFVSDRAKKGDHHTQNQIVNSYYKFLSNSGIYNKEEDKLMDGKYKFMDTKKLSDDEIDYIASKIRYWVEVSIKSQNLDVMNGYASNLLKGRFPFERDRPKGVKMLEYISEQCDIKSGASMDSARELATFYSHIGQMHDYVESYKWANISLYMSDDGSPFLVKELISEMKDLMEPSQISQAQKESRAWTNKYCK